MASVAPKSVGLVGVLTMAITPSRQCNAVSEGIALGLLMCDRNALRWEKVGIDLSFAWRSWQHREHFPQVNTLDIRQGLDGVWELTARMSTSTPSISWDTYGPRARHLSATDLGGRRCRRRPGRTVDRRQRPSRPPA
jgi:hypothetical protein